jgi:5-formyltetrahydrofolate cyclo-ligase
MKKEIRSSILKKRNNIRFPEILEKSRRIKDQLFHTQEFKDAKTILFYISYHNEVNTHEMIQDSLMMKKRIVVPKTDVNTRTITCSAFTQWDDLRQGPYTILEPRQECVKEVSLDTIDLIVLPGIAFDCHGNRIGHGLGCFDRLLQKKIHAHLFGLAFELQIVESIPPEKHDKKVEKIITEDRIINCS